MTRLYLIGGLTAALVAAWGLSLRYAYTSGHDAATAAQKAADSTGALTVHERANEANSSIDSGADPDGLLRDTNGLRDDESGAD